MNEEWKDIPGYEGIYQASTLGRIRTCEGKTTSNSKYECRVWKQRILKQKLCGSKRADYRVELWNGNIHKTWLVSRLIALTWCNGYSDGLTVNHIDGNHLNNKANNLEWVSIGNNIRHGFENGLFHTQKRCALIDSNGKRTEYRSINQASRSIGRSDRYISTKLFRHKQIRSIDGKIYKFEFC